MHFTVVDVGVAENGSGMERCITGVLHELYIYTNVQSPNIRNLLDWRIGAVAACIKLEYADSDCISVIERHKVG